MTKLEQLIEELCPNGVEFKKIKDVFRRLKGTPITAGKMKEIETPDGEIRIFAGGKTVINAKESDIPNANITRVPAVLVQSRGVIDVVYYEKPFTFKNEMWAYTVDNKVTVKFLYYVLKNNIQQFRDAASGMGSLPQISLPVTEEFVIPVPPLPVQSEIVKILDNFTELTAELTAELAARKKQYDFYTEQLMNFGDNVKILTLGEIGSVKMCKRILKEQTNTTGGIPFYKIGTFGKTPDAYITEELFEEFRTKYSYPKKGDILISCSGTIGRTVVFDGEPAYFQDSNIVWLEHDSTVVTNKYLLYCYKKQPWQISTGGTIARLYNDNILKAKIPVPPIEEQERIVEILERFDALCNDISVGLPAEIEARQKQYEYYRDKLLTFKEVTTV
jgi:type I restriction enzyme S subunit